MAAKRVFQIPLARLGPADLVRIDILSYRRQSRLTPRMRVTSGNSIQISKASAASMGFTRMILSKECETWKSSLSRRRSSGITR